VIPDIVRERGPLTVAAFMDLALYDPQYGYYARSAQRSGRAGDFFTSVDVGPLFGELLAIQIAEMAALLAASTASSASAQDIDLVEGGAGNGRLAADVLQAMRRRDPGAYERIRLTLVDASLAARAAQQDTMARFGRPFASRTTLPDSFEGILFANELLDALPVHQVVMRDEGLREVHVTASHAGENRLTTIEERPSTPALAMYLERLGIELEPGWRVEINLRAVDWVRDAARRLRRGFIILIDYGHTAAQLYSASHSAGTLTTFSRHVARDAAPERSTPAWLRDPGQQDITAHVDFTTLRETAEAEGLTTIGFLDQTYFVLGLLPHLEDPAHAVNRVHPVNPVNPVNLQLKTLLMPGGLGSTMKVLILARGMGQPALRGCSYRMRVT
jgi:SAM-dependent MidA family methyltransferase